MTIPNTSVVSQGDLLYFVLPGNSSQKVYLFPEMYTLKKDGESVNLQISLQDYITSEKCYSFYFSPETLEVIIEALGLKKQKNSVIQASQNIFHVSCEVVCNLNSVLERKEENHFLRLSCSLKDSKAVIFSTETIPIVSSEDWLNETGSYRYYIFKEVRAWLKEKAKEVSLW